MFEIKNFHRNIYVDGNIFFDTDKEVSYVDLVCLSDINKDECSEIITTKEGCLYVNNDQIRDDDAVYHSKGEISSSILDLPIKNNPYCCIYAYNNNLSDLNDVFNLNVDISKRKILNRMIFTSILSNYEFFMADICVSCFLRFDNIKEKIRDVYTSKSDNEITYSLKKRFYSDFEKTSNFFIGVFEIELPDYEFLNKAFVDKRNHIVHRYDRYLEEKDLLIITNKDVEDLVRETNKFVYELFKRVKDKVYGSSSITP